ncbi:MAG: hypothetical protein FJ109_14075 [Deltaproteobacteria bacterium]|nr:hypothetical protein [Deltaproteobacteria bacterium]
MQMLHGLVALLVLGVGIGCSGPSGSGDTDGSPLVDAQREAVADASGSPDSLLPDANVPDSLLPDANVPDSLLPDAHVPDSLLPDANVPESLLPDAHVPDSLLPDANVPESLLPDGNGPDSALPDGVLPDALSDQPAPPDESGEAPPPAEPFATVSGECGEIDLTELYSPSPFLFVNHLDFADDPYDEADFGLLCPGGQEVILDGNAGGSSILSEAFSFEVLYWCEGAQLLKTEMEIDYKDEAGKITDLLVLIDGLKVGVSVSRAVSWPKDAPYLATQAGDLLKKKLSGIQASTANVKPEDAWTKQILHVLAWSEGHATVLEEVWEGLDPSVKGDTILLVTITDGDDAFLY